MFRIQVKKPVSSLLLEHSTCFNCSLNDNASFYNKLSEDIPDVLHGYGLYLCIPHTEHMR